MTATAVMPAPTEPTHHGTTRFHESAMRMNPITQAITQAAVISRLVVMPHNPTASQVEMSERSLDTCDLVIFPVECTRGELTQNSSQMSVHRGGHTPLPPYGSDWRFDLRSLSRQASAHIR